jgi:hypothetical protein
MPIEKTVRQIEKRNISRKLQAKAEARMHCLSGMLPLSEEDEAVYDDFPSGN